MTLSPVFLGEFLPLCLVTVTDFSGGKMSQPLLLLYPKKTSSLWWLNHMLTSWQRSAPAPTACLKAADTVCTHQKQQWITKASEIHICDPLRETSHLGTNMFHIFIAMALKGHKSKLLNKMLTYKTVKQYHFWGKIVLLWGNSNKKNNTLSGWFPYLYPSHKDLYRQEMIAKLKDKIKPFLLPQWCIVCGNMRSSCCLVTACFSCVGQSALVVLLHIVPFVPHV